MNNEGRIQMEISTHLLENSISNLMMLRFSKLIQGILEELDDKSLTNSKIASKSWCDFIEDKKFPFIRKWKNSKKTA